MSLFNSAIIYQALYVPGSVVGGGLSEEQRHRSCTGHALKYLQASNSIDKYSDKGQDKVLKERCEKEIGDAVPADGGSVCCGCNGQIHTDYQVLWRKRDGTAVTGCSQEGGPK